MAINKMPISTATITVSGTNASGKAVQIYDVNGPVGDITKACTVPPKGKFILDIVPDETYDFASLSLGGEAPEWMRLVDQSKAKKIRVTGTAPEGFKGAKTISIVATVESESYVFPSEKDALTIIVDDIEPEPEPGPEPEPEKADLIFVEGGAVGGGLANVFRILVRSDAYEYQAGGIPLPPSSLILGVAGVSVKGGATAFYDESSHKVLLYRAGRELSGTLVDLSLVLFAKSNNS